jgi:pseudouridine-5'-phosphate glycosidase/pseudouridine kinase
LNLIFQQAGRLVVTEEVEHALETGTKGVIALETAIVTHGSSTRLIPSSPSSRSLPSDLHLILFYSRISGMPYPANLNTALSLERIIREISLNTVIPATIALLQGQIHIGLTQTELSRLSEPEVSKKSIKVSKRDLAVAVARKLDGGTTVAGTMALASRVGIETFVTGGIGGVHRGAQSSE